MKEYIFGIENYKILMKIKGDCTSVIEGGDWPRACSVRRLPPSGTGGHPAVTWLLIQPHCPLPETLIFLTSRCPIQCPVLRLVVLSNQSKNIIRMVNKIRRVKLTNIITICSFLIIHKVIKLFILIFL